MLYKGRVVGAGSRALNRIERDITVRRAAEILDCTEAMVLDMVEKGKLTADRREGGLVLNWRQVCEVGNDEGFFNRRRPRRDSGTPR
jgi:hypothetical protein